MLSITFIVFLAGCTSKGPVSTASGVVITSFGPDLAEVDGKSTVTFTTLVQNIGGRTASEIKVLFFGLSNEWDKDINTESVEPFEAKLDTSSITTLAPADPSSGLKGEEGSADLTVIAPSGKSNDVSYDISTRVFYKYTTESDTVLRFIESDYVKTNPNTPKGIVSHSSTSGALNIIATARTPILSKSSTTGRIQFEIQNVGNGRVFNGFAAGDANTPKDLDVISTITVSGLGTRGKCGDKTGNSLTLDPTRLAGGKSKIISCDIDVSGITNFADRAIKVVITYSYFVDEVSHATVLKSFDENPSAPTPQPSAGQQSGTGVAVDVCKGKAENIVCTVVGDIPLQGICCVVSGVSTCVGKGSC